MNAEALAFLELLHGGLRGHVAIWAKLNARAGAHDGSVNRSNQRTFYARPGKWPNVPAWVEAEAVTVAVSPCTFTGRRRLAANALEIPALWAEVDPPGGGADLVSWRAAALRELQNFRPAPSLIVDSGRGFHGYWLLLPIVQLEGADRDRLAALVAGCNRALAARLGGDTVGDMARVLRLPGTLNRKPGGGPCLVLSADGPRYQLADLVAELRPEPALLGQAARGDAAQLVPAATMPAKPRQRGRPSLGVTQHDLRSLPPWARALVEGGAFRAGRRYMREGGGGLDRSRADWAAVGAMVRADWPDARIVAAFARPDWFIGDRYRYLRDQEGQARADGYLARTIAKARAWAAGAVMPSDEAITEPPALTELARLVEAGDLDGDRLARYLADVREV